jgi:hypothetical protein
MLTHSIIPRISLLQTCSFVCSDAGNIIIIIFAAKEPEESESPQHLVANAPLHPMLHLEPHAAPLNQLSLEAPWIFRL